MTPLQQARELLRPGQRIVCFSGAGLSAESGISTFRDNDTHALWRQYNPMEMASPEGFARDPARVMQWYAWRRERLGAASPNAAHRALAVRSDIFHVTQNVDDLLERAGVSDANIAHVHGTILRDHCHGDCGHSARVDLTTPPLLRRCERCGDWMRPSVVWFGESLPPQVWESAQQRCFECDTLLVVGTSAVVYPAAGLIRDAKRNGGRVIVVNPESSDASSLADVELTGRAGDILPLIL
jgi:NAD-dependent deacetylase